MTSGPIPAGSPSETASGYCGGADTFRRLNGNARSAEFNHRVAPKIAEVAPRAEVHAFLVQLIVDIVVSRRARVDLIAPADHERPDAFLERAEWLSRLANLHRKHHLLQRGRKVAHLHIVALHDFAVEVRRELLRTAAAADVVDRLGEAG